MLVGFTYCCILFGSIKNEPKCYHQFMPISSFWEKCFRTEHLSELSGIVEEDRCINCYVSVF